MKLNDIVIDVVYCYQCKRKCTVIEKPMASVHPGKPHTRKTLEGPLEGDPKVKVKVRFHDTEEVECVPASELERASGAG